MILIADSGSTKTDWKIIHEIGEESSFKTIGLNPYHYSEDEYFKLMENAIAGYVKADTISEVFFYGSGCAMEAMNKRVNRSLSRVFIHADIQVFSDILGAARALFFNNQGLVLVLGTGSSVGFYNGVEVLQRTTSLGYLLGDEGSATYLCKELIKRWQYGELSVRVSDLLSTYCSLPISEILKKIYFEPSPVKFLTSFMKFIAVNAQEPEVAKIIQESFSELILRHLTKFPEFPNTPIGIVGSVGNVFKDQLENVLSSFGGVIQTTLQYPIEGLVCYHKRK